MLLLPGRIQKLLFFLFCFFLTRSNCLSSNTVLIKIPLAFLLLLICCDISAIFPKIATEAVIRSFPKYRKFAILNYARQGGGRIETDWHLKRSKTLTVTVFTQRCVALRFRSTTFRKRGRVATVKVTFSSLP